MAVQTIEGLLEETLASHNPTENHDMVRMLKAGKGNDPASLKKSQQILPRWQKFQAKVFRLTKKDRDAFADALWDRIMPEQGDSSADPRNFGFWEQKGVTYLINGLGDVIQEDGGYVGRWNGKTLNRNFPTPSHIQEMYAEHGEP